jgi:hypothetical protein
MFTDYLSWQCLLAASIAILVILFSAFAYEHIRNPNILWFALIGVIGIEICATKVVVDILKQRIEDSVKVSHLQSSPPQPMSPATQTSEITAKNPIAFTATGMEPIFPGVALGDAPDKVALEGNFAITHQTFIQTFTLGIRAFYITGHFLACVKNTGDKPLMIARYTVERQWPPGGNWSDMLSIPARDGYMATEGVGPRNFEKLKDANPGVRYGRNVRFRVDCASSSFDLAIAGKNILPGETVTGRIYLASPAAAQGIGLRMRILDIDGNEAVSDINFNKSTSSEIPPQIPRQKIMGIGDFTGVKLRLFTGRDYFPPDPDDKNNPDQPQDIDPQQSGGSPATNP